MAGFQDAARPSGHDGSAETDRPRFRSRLMVVSLIVMAGFCSLDRVCMALTVDLVRTDLGLSETQMGLVLGLSFSLLYSLAGIPIGLLADRYSRRYLLAGACALWSAATVACGFVESFQGIFVARMLVGAGEAALWPVAVSIVGDLVSPRNRGSVLGWLIIGQLVGSSLSLMIGGQILSRGSQGAFQDLALIGAMTPWRILFILFGGAGAIAITMILFAHEPARASQIHPQSGAQPHQSLSVVVAFFRKNWRLIAGLYVVGTLMALAQYAGASWMLPTVMRRFAIPAADIGFTWGLLGLAAGVAGSLLGGYVTRHFQTPLARCNLLIVATLVCALEGILVFQPGIGVTFLMAGAVAAVHGVVGVTKYLLVQEIFPDTMRGIGTAILNVLVNLVGASSGPFMVALLTERVFRDDNMVGVSLGLIAGPGALLTTAAAFWLRAEFKRRAQRSAPGSTSSSAIGLRTEPA